MWSSVKKAGQCVATAMATTCCSSRSEVTQVCRRLDVGEHRFYRRIDSPCDEVVRVEDFQQRSHPRAPMRRGRLQPDLPRRSPSLSVHLPARTTLIRNTLTKSN